MTPGTLHGLHGDVRVLGDKRSVADAGAALIDRLASTAAAQHGRFSVALAGGGTPRLLYETLSSGAWRDRIDWSRWDVYFGDERACPPDDAASNYRMARETLLDRVPIDAARVHRMEADLPDLDGAARAYSALLEAALPRAATGAPRIDCILLGMGENGHTASLFPGTEALAVGDSWATRGRADYAPYDRITLTYPAINAAANVVFLVTGAAKRDALRATAAGRTPSAGVAPVDGALEWIVDRSAAGGEV
ncbi:MAG: 6-phosphogluconolactonase [Candidatus Dormibacteraeota bacterium]|nr:6-phosphogluconolactonase [Candidatus Dormibacteraeota bacterium]